MRNVVVQVEAQRETDEAFTWYEEQEAGVGFRLLHELEITCAAIARRPEIFQPVGRGFRRALLRTFPYAIFFDLDGDRVVVHSVFHCSRNPAIWKSRLTTVRKRRIN